MLDKLLRWIKGYLCVEVKGSSPERLFNLCRKHGIYVWNISKRDNICCFCILIRDYFRINAMAVKCRTFPKIKKRIGLPFHVRALLDRRTLLPCFAMFIITLFYLSLFVWSVNVSGQHRYTKEEISEYLSGLGIHRMMWKSRLDADAAEKQMRNDYKDIGWVSVSLEGTDIYVRLLESDLPASAIKTGDYSSLIASEDGVVNSIITRSGTPLVRTGDKVKKGQVLVSGIVEYPDDSGEIYKKNPVYADADISLLVKRKYNKSFSMMYDKKEYTGRNKTEWAFVYNNNLFMAENILNKFETYEKYDIMNEILCSGMLIKKIIREYEVIGRTYTQENAIKKSADILSEYIDNLVKDNIVILDKKIIASIKDGMCKSYGWLNMLVPQKERELVTEKDWRVIGINEQDRKDN